MPTKLEEIYGITTQREQGGIDPSTQGGKQSKPNWMRSIEGAEARARALAPFVRFLESIGKTGRAQRKSDQLSDVNRFLERKGASTIGIPDELSEEERREMFLRFANTPKRAAQASMLLQMEGKDRAMELLDTAGDVADEAGYRQVLSFARNQLEDPRIIDDETQRLIEGGIMRERNRAAESFERMHRSSLAARGLPGTPALSGRGIEEMGDFRRELASETGGKIADTRIRQAIANKEYGNQINAFMADLINNDPEMRALFTKAGIEANLPVQSGGFGMSDFSSLLSAMEYADEAGDRSGSDLLSTLGPAALTVLGSIIAPGVGTAIGSAAGAGLSAATKKGPAPTYNVGNRYWKNIDFGDI